ncbi:HpcH/HpaI aldolase family protein [Streptosporangium longisporum]|uniref:HpcH/HpaI aldolase/citrate lyase family protein n=1 Tax=Streptosporangium longisporum TaxID=46187 RepID=A0ABP6KEB4_9ACTN
MTVPPGPAAPSCGPATREPPSRAVPAAGVAALRRRLRDALTGGDRVVGTFLKLPSTDCVDLARQAGFDFVVVDLEHSSLPEATALALVRHAAATGLPALVRVPAVDPALINRVLEAGAAGVQLSTLTAVAEVAALTGATRYAPHGRRSVSLSHPAAGFGAVDLAAYLAAEAQDPPLLVGQIETAVTLDPVQELVGGLDVAFVGTTDLAVGMGLPGPEALRAKVEEIVGAALSAGVAPGGWIARADEALLTGGGLGAARYLVVGSDVQLLGSALREVIHRWKEAQ